MAQKRKAEKNLTPAAGPINSGSGEFPGAVVLRRVLLVILFFVSPLIFFTGLTRNPYYTQIVLLNIAVLLCGVFPLAALWRAKPVRWRFCAPDIPWAAWIAVCGLSLFISYFGHVQFFRPAIASEGLRAFLFLTVNAFGAYILGKHAPPDLREEKPSGWLLLFILWAILWAMYPGFRQPSGGMGIAGRIFDPYGAVLWAVGFATAFMALRKCSREDIFNLAAVAGAIAAVYGVFQYFGFEPIWSKALNPYGSRSVSTFGNPNFLSSFLVVLLPPVFVSFLKSSGSRRMCYGTMFLLYVMSLLCSLTRSSWLGALVGMAFLLLLPEVRSLLRKSAKPAAVLAGICMVIIPLWPSGTVTQYNPSVVERVKELKGMKTSSLPALDGVNGVYAPWHQRLLIWSNCMAMGLENPVTGKGWGTLEMFYPYYQGPLLRTIPNLKDIRTHANNAHNEIIEAFSQTGLLGLGVRIWLFVVFFAGYFAFRRKVAAPENLFAAGAVAGMAGMLADNMLNVSLHFAVPGFIFWWFAGTVAADCCGFKAVNLSAVRPALRKTAALFAAAVLVFLTWFWLGQWLREVYYFEGFAYARRGEISSALTALEKSASWKGREVNALYELANTYARAGQDEQALAGYNLALAANPGYDEIFFNRALIERKLGNPEAALNSARVCAWINPFSYRIYDLMAEIFLTDQKRFAPLCLPALRSAVQLYPEDISLKSVLGVMEVAAGNTEQAGKVFLAGALQSPLSDVLFSNYQRTLRDSGNAASPELERIIKLRDLGRQADAGRTDPAFLAEIDREIAREPKLEFPAILKARVLYVRKDFSGAEKVLNSIIAENPHSASAFAGLSAISAARGDLTAARQLLTRVLNADPHNREAQANMARLQQGSQN